MEQVINSTCLRMVSDRELSYAEVEQDMSDILLWYAWRSKDSESLLLFE
jgi:hypothetical protein